MSDREVSVSTRAYAKMLLHAARYPHASVCGLLLAGTGGGPAVHLQDTVPLFHQCLHVSPMYEIALTQVDAAATAADQVLAGLYMACENLQHNTIDKVPDLRVADKIAENYPNALLIIVNNRRLTQQLERSAITVYQHHADGSWRPKDNSNLIFKSPSASSTVAGLIQQGVQRELVDLDNHLDDLTQDWSNRALHTLLHSLDHDSLSTLHT